MWIIFQRFFNLETGNDLKCSWVTGAKFYDWASTHRGIIQDIDETFCFPDRDVFGHMTILAALKVRKVNQNRPIKCLRRGAYFSILLQMAWEECNNAKCECDIWTTTVVEKGEDSALKTLPVVHQNKYGNVYLTLKMDCSNMGIQELPAISPYTVVLVSKFINC